MAAFFRSTVTLFGASITLVGGLQEGLDRKLPVSEHQFALGRDVIPTICGTVPCIGVALPTVKRSLAVFGGDIGAVVASTGPSLASGVWGG